jgi:hypothetical protein
VVTIRRVDVDGSEIRTLGPGDFFGELVLFGTEFRQLQQQHPEIAGRIESGLREIARAA